MTLTKVDDRGCRFSRRTAEPGAPGESPSEPVRRDQLEVLNADGDAAASDCVRLSVVHGVPQEREARIHLAQFYNDLGKLVAKAEWHRLLIEPDHIVVEVAGAGAQAGIDQIADVAELMNPGSWRISRSAHPDLSPPS